MAFEIKTGDTSPAYECTLLSQALPVDLAGASIRFIMATDPAPRTVVVDTAAVLVQVGDGSDGSKGKVRYEWTVEDTATAGAHVAEWEVVYASGKRQTFPNSGYETVTINDDLGGTA